jgi:transcriptional regulator GlxA family with amidase domain
VSGTAAKSDRIPASVRSLEQRGNVHYLLPATATAAKLTPLAEPKLSVAFILLHEFTLFAFSGFVDALRIAGDELDNSRQRECRWTVIAPTLQPVRANCGVEITPWETFPDPSQFDYVVVIGGRMEPQRNTDPRILEYCAASPTAGSRSSASVPRRSCCASGVMKGRRCCVPWNARLDFEEEFPSSASSPTRSSSEDSDRITCPGGQSSADVALHLIGKHCGAASAPQRPAAGMVLGSDARQSLAAAAREASGSARSANRSCAVRSRSWIASSARSCR